ncbi:MAG: TM2 domain-containing protein [Rhodopirellula sp.]|nr:TM2 domain-containing protein [Rhodopirellula sp.]
MMPFFGLHRFYTGKIFSGVVYLLTLGLFGVGQLVDVILIALGEFRDAEGRLLQSRETSEAVNGLSSVPTESRVSNGLAVLGGLVLAATILVGFALVIDVPRIIASDMFRGVGLTGSDFLAIFGTSTWPELLRELLQLLAGVLAFFSVSLLLASRRSMGLVHALRVLVAAIPFGIAFGLLMQAVDRVSWARVTEGVRQEKVGVILEEFLRNNDFIPSCIGGAVAFAVGLLILSLPPRQQPAPIVKEVLTPIEQGHQS